MRQWEIALLSIVQPLQIPFALFVIVGFTKTSLEIAPNVHLYQIVLMSLVRVHPILIVLLVKMDSISIVVLVSLVLQLTIALVLFVLLLQAQCVLCVKMGIFSAVALAFFLVALVLIKVALHVLSVLPWKTVTVLCFVQPILTLSVFLVVQATT